ncbi:hypothetical protein TEA_003316 [Camellia sinensis var. sinensis]|uniref:Major facilitator superfamily (MFS) profile domain-containing protein n=1 Tax=Camellia sinensis var. sinensis TaxID=542762 RepID=A0A4S4D033_CAMSN|nr:hypothetical protein TEA_003316 [Camellia sinensis var. sinensis]
MWGRKRDASSMYKRVSSKDHINGHYRDDDGRLHNGIGKETGNPSWKHSLPHVLVATFSSFLFGYHLGVVNDTLESISMDLGFSGNTIAEGLVVSTCLGGAFVGSLFSGWIADGVGRRRAFQLCALPMIIGASMSATTNTLGGMLLGRFFVGTGMGLGPPVAALYVSEVSPAFVRGTYGSFTQIATCLGLMGALFIGIPAKDIVGWWRVCFWVSAIPAAVLAVLMEFCAESPHWLFKRGRIAEAEIEFEKLLGGSHFKSAVSELSKSDRGDEADAVKFSELFYGRHFKVVFIGSTLFALQQLSGINAVFYFSSAVFRSVGVPSDIANICVGIANLSVSMGVQVAAASSIVSDSGAVYLSVGGILLFVFTFALGAGPVPGLLLSEIFPSRIRAKGMAVCMAVHWMMPSWEYDEIIHQCSLQKDWRRGWALGDRVKGECFRNGVGVEDWRRGSALGDRVKGECFRNGVGVGVGVGMLHGATM